MGRSRRGQSTTEFAMMIPVIFALLFAVIEYAYYMGAVHYVNYATFSAARALQVGDSPDDVAADLLTGTMVDYRHGDVSLDVDDTIGRVRSSFIWDAQTPGFRQVMGDMSVDMQVTLGPPECEYESAAALARAGVTSRAYRYGDNRMECP